MGGMFSYSSYGQSTLSAMDTIAVTAGSGQIFNLRQDNGGLSLASQADTADGFTATNGVVQFTASYENNITSRYEALDGASLLLVLSPPSLMAATASSSSFGVALRPLLQVGSTTLGAASTQSTGLGVTLGGGNTTIQLNLIQVRDPQALNRALFFFFIMAKLQKIVAKLRSLVTANDFQSIASLYSPDLVEELQNEPALVRSL